MSGKKEHKKGDKPYRQEKKWKLSEEDQGVDKRVRKNQHTKTNGDATSSHDTAPEEMKKKDDEGESSSDELSDVKLWRQDTNQTFGPYQDHPNPSFGNMSEKLSIMISNN